MSDRDLPQLDSSSSLHHHIHEMHEVFQRADAATQRFAQASRLACPPGCGACCNNPAVEATVAELLPLAASLVARGVAEDFYSRAAAQQEKRCILFQQAGSNPHAGKCTQYAERPLICRLFGYAGVRSQGGLVSLVACKTLKALPVDEAATLPLMPNHAMEALAVARSGGFGVERLPINQALMQALAYVALRCRMEAQNDAG